MSYYFENTSRYQIIFPYTSDKIYVEGDLDHGVFQCYQEIKKLNVKTPVFMVHNIDAGSIYTIEIPKYKHLNLNMINNNNPTNIQLKTAEQHIINRYDVPFSSNNITNHAKELVSSLAVLPTPNIEQPQINAPSFTSINSIPINASINSVPINPSINLVPVNPSINSMPINAPINSMLINAVQTEYDKMRQNEIITRLHNVEYQLDMLKRIVDKKPEKDENACILF